MSSEYRSRWLYLLSIRNDDDASTPAPPEDQIEGSEKNPKGSAGGDSDEEIEFSEQTEKSIQSGVINCWSTQQQCLNRLANKRYCAE